ncbi:MAG: TM2 domain-containing protein [Clostridia bacterium]|nr:TM2 domain-containing protein [Clostridia bacterium]
MAKEKLFKKCPRCGEKTFINARACDGCKLVFARMEFASNKQAKRELKAGNKEAVIKTNQYPKDYNRWKTLIICFVGGLFGAHNIYLGRYFKGFFSLCAMLVLCGLILAVPSSTLAVLFAKWMFIPYGILAIMWLSDIMLIALGKYKIPVALEEPKNNVVVENEQK